MERQAEADAPVRRQSQNRLATAIPNVIIYRSYQVSIALPYPKSPKPIAEADIAAPAGLFIYCFELRIILRMPDKKHKTLSYV